MSDPGLRAATATAKEEAPQKPAVQSRTVWMAGGGIAVAVLWLLEALPGLLEQYGGLLPEKWRDVILGVGAVLIAVNQLRMALKARLAAKRTDIVAASVGINPTDLTEAAKGKTETE